MARIEFFSQDIVFKFPKPRKTSLWIQQVIQKEKKELVHLNYILCSDLYLLSINEQYLKHTTLTDIITFDNSDDPALVEGDIFISAERVRANSVELGIDFEQELMRVVVHGVLHLLGYGDKTPSEKLTMRKKEDAYLSLRNQLK